MKKFSAIFVATMLVFTMASCGEDDAVDEGFPTNQLENNAQNVEPTNPETKENESNSENANESNSENANESNSENANESNSENANESNGKNANENNSENTNKSDNDGESGMDQQENNVQGVGDSDLEATADELFDLFINGSISAVSSTDFTSTFYITDLNMDSEEWDSYSIGEKVDLDNDGEDELIINGPYGGIYLDARDNKVYEFAVGEGTALILSYTYYNGAVWIMYSNRSSAGFEFYHMEKFEGADNLVAEMNFGEEFDINNAEAGLKYTMNETEISYDEYTELCSRIFAAEVNTNVQSEANNDGTASYANLYIQKVAENTDSYTVFSLIFLDNDDIPELFAYDRGNSISSIYTVKDGSIYCLVDSMSVAEMTYFEHSGIIASFASWNGGGDEGGYGIYYYQVSNDITLTDDSSSVLNNTYNATYDEEGAYTGTGVTSYYYMGQETDKESYQQQLDSLGIVESNGKPCQENALGKEEMLSFLNQ